MAKKKKKKRRAEAKTGVVLDSSPGGEWKEKDRLYFEQHPGVNWLLRPAYRWEWDSFEIIGPGSTADHMARSLRNYALTCSALAVEEKVLVAQIAPGKRMRLPILGRPGVESDLIMYPDGTSEHAKDAAARLTAEFADAPECLPAGGDTCEVCGRAFAVEATLHVDVAGRVRCVCMTCSSTGRLPSGSKVMSMSLYIPNNPTEEQQKQIPVVIAAIRDFLKSRPKVEN
jgi:hypothetical protein